MTVTRHNEKASRKIRTSLTQGNAARKLGVTREHLNRVLNGHRDSQRLRTAYESLIARQHQSNLEPCL